MSIHDLVSVSKLFIGFSLILIYKFLTNNCDASSSFCGNGEACSTYGHK